MHPRSQQLRNFPCWFLLVSFFAASVWAASSSSAAATSSSRAPSNIIRQPRSFNIHTHLPGFDGPLPFELETGYVPLDDEYGSQLFYYFVRSEGDPATDPLMIWLTGGPGCSSLSGFLFEIGPLMFNVVDYDGSLPTLVYRDETWTKVSNIIFLDSSIGDGFSYSKKPRSNSDLKTNKDVLLFLKRWFVEHPEFSSNPFYVGGDSYSGITVPTVANEIANDNELIEDIAKINLKGYLVGNPLTDERIDNGSYIPYAHGMGLISDELYEATKETCGGELWQYTSPPNTNCAANKELINQLLEGINVAHILYPNCDANSIRKQGVSKMNRDTKAPMLSVKIQPDCLKQVHTLSEIWTNIITVREALKIHEGSINVWIRCNSNMIYIKDVPSSQPYHFNLTQNGYRALVYSGDHDLKIPHVGTQAWIKSFGYDILDSWRPWKVDGEVGGYTTTFSNNLTFATIKGGGHTAAEYQPNACQTMFQRWIKETPL